MKIVVAVSGGVDSVVLLDALSGYTEHELVVAHFDHGMREDSAADARFVQELADRYGLVAEVGRQRLEGASEEVARAKRYEFLFEVAQKYGARLATAHHMDDVIETIALNVQRGTQWRGLAGMSDERIWRPLVNRTKSELIAYAVRERLEWVEDETNRQDIYTRNRIRRRLTSLSPDVRSELFGLWRKQVALRASIAEELGERDFPVYSRYFMTMIEPSVALTILHTEILKVVGASLLTSQLERMLLALKVGRPGSTYQVGGGIAIELALKDWRIKEV